MAQPKQKQPQDPYVQQGKVLASAVRKLRGWVGSDPSRTGELADALVDLTGHRLLGHEFETAVVDAQDAVKYAAQQLTLNGPIGPYTAVSDAARYQTAVVHLAAIQAALGMTEAAGRSLGSLSELRRQLTDVRIVPPPLDPIAAVWAVLTRARGALAAGDVATANGFGDVLLAASDPLSVEPDTELLRIDLFRLAADARWAAGHQAESLGHLHHARGLYEATTGGRLDEPRRVSPAVLARLAEPFGGLYRDIADRLSATGEAELGLVTRRAAADTLSKLVLVLGSSIRLQWIGTLTDLAADLLWVGRTGEGARAVEQADDALAAVPSDAPGRERVRLLLAVTRASVQAASGHPKEAIGVLESVLATAAPVPIEAVARLALAEALAADDQHDAAAAAMETARRAVAVAFEQTGLVDPGVDADRLRVVRDLARGVVPRAASTSDWPALPSHEPFVADLPTVAAQTDLDAAAEHDAAAWLAADRAEAERIEQERLVQAEQEAERLEAERVEAALRAAAEAELDRVRAAAEAREQAERRAAAEEAERVERKRRREERLEAHRLEVEQAERQEAERLERERRELERRELERSEAERGGARLDGEGPESVDQNELDELAAQVRALELAERAEADRIDRERLEAEEQDQAQRAAEVERAEQAEAQRLRADRWEAERREHLRQAEQAEAEQAEAERIEAEAARVEAERTASERAEAEAEEARLEADRVETVRAEAARAEAARAEAARAETERVEAERLGAPDAPVPAEEAAAPGSVELTPLAEARQRWQEARARGERRAARAALEVVVEELRSLAATDFATYAPQLRDALDDLASARLRTGDVFGSRAPAREAKALSKTIGD